jgi:hypothetical protein
MEAFTVMLDVSADPKYHSVITGKVAGGGRAKLKLEKTFKTKLSPGNPTGKKSISERQLIKFTTDRDGSFELHVSPSSRPYEKKTESFRLYINRGKQLDVLFVKVRRGQRLDLGRIKLRGGVGIELTDSVVFAEPDKH